MSPRTALVLAAALAASSCSQSPPPTPPTASGDSPAASPTLRPQPVANNETDEAAQPEIVPRLTNVASGAGIDFAYFTGTVPGRLFLPEIMGGGVGWLDYDADGRLDLYLVNGAPLPNNDPHQTEHVNRLYRNRGDGSFEDVTDAAGVGHNGYGHGCAVGDYNTDGFPDLYVTNYGPDVLYLNNGDGTFRDVTAAAAVGDEHWSFSAAWADLDGDADLDLYVANYLNVTFANHQTCEYNGQRGYCGPGSYEALPNTVFINQGDGSFVESAGPLGLVGEDGKSLVVAVVDLNDDLVPEIYVGNDMTANFLFVRQADPAADPLYREIATPAGCGLSGAGEPEATMGIACADYDGDGRSDIFLTHYFRAKNTLYRNLGNLRFHDDSRRTRIAATSYSFLGFGTVALDYDRDGAPDLFVANGHVLGPDIEPFAMQPQLLHNDGRGLFDDVSSYAGPYFHDFWLGRGAGAADYDNDGDLDIAVSHLDRQMALLRNDTQTGRRFIGFVLASGNRLPPVGGRLVVHVGDQRQTVPIVSGGSYLSSSDPRILIGLGDGEQADAVEVHWPSGRVDRWPDLAADRYWTLQEGRPPAPVVPEAPGAVR